MVAGLTPVSFHDLPGWCDDDPRAVLRGLQRCGRHASTVKPYKPGRLGIQWPDFEPAVSALDRDSPDTAKAARSFFENNFVPFWVQPDGDNGFVTAYYEPELGVSAAPNDTYRFPIHRKPEDLLSLDKNNRPADLDPSFAYGRRQGGRIVEYADRRAIDNGFLDGRGLEIAWARSRTDLFFVHVQGAARLCYPDGAMQRVTYAAKTGHPFTAIGRVLIDRGELNPQNVSMQGIKGWLADNPQQADELLWCNRSYIFFRQADVNDPEDGPIAAAKVPLMAGRSLAVDKQLHTFGTPIFVQATGLTHIDDAPFRRLMLAQDTGTAIVGPARGDIFTGSGPAAGELAGTVKHQATFHMLVPTAAAQRFKT